MARRTQAISSYTCCTLYGQGTRQQEGELKILLGLAVEDPGVDRGGKGKSKLAEENGEEKHNRARRAPGDTFLPDQFQTEF